LEPSPLPINRVASLLAVFVNRRGYFVAQCVERDLSVNAKGGRYSGADAEWLLKGDTESSRERALEAFQLLRRGVLRSLALTAAIVVAAATCAALFGAIRPDLPWHGGKVLQVFGGAFATWSGVLAAMPPEATFQGDSVPEEIHPLAFGALLAAGAMLGMLGSMF
jgi:hypothetical protein